MGSEQLYPRMGSEQLKLFIDLIKSSFGSFFVTCFITITHITDKINKKFAKQKKIRTITSTTHY